MVEQIGKGPPIPSVLFCTNTIDMYLYARKANLRSQTVSVWPCKHASAKH